MSFFSVKAGACYAIAEKLADDMKAEYGSAWGLDGPFFFQLGMDGWSLRSTAELMNKGQ
jgi:hypothetical protein